MSCDRQSFGANIIDALELAAHADFEDVDAEMLGREEVATDAVARMMSRKRALGAAYPFDVDRTGDTVTFTADDISADGRDGLAQTAYLICLVLSNLRSLSPVLDDGGLHPGDDEVRQLRRHFQHFATAAVAAEIQGPAWSFGFPRPDGSGFIGKLTEIWSELRDGVVRADPSAPSSPRDDQVDVFAARLAPDRLPGFLLAAAQVATGKDWKDKSVKSHIDDAFVRRWFGRAPATKMIAYHVVPFARPDDKFRDDVLVLGNVLHRLRVPRRVAEAHDLAREGLPIEAFDQLASAAGCLRSYIVRTRGT